MLIHNIRKIVDTVSNQSEELASKLAESERIQIELATRVIREDVPPFEDEYVTGMDVSYREDRAYACAVIHHLPTRTVVKTGTLITNCEYPYIPGHFYLREGPVLIKLLERIEDTGPILVDGNGILHPRRMGLASYIGVKTGRQIIGIAKSLLLGEVAERKDNCALVSDAEEVIGAALWIGNKQKPVYVSVGHKISLKTAIEITLAASFENYPEPLRQAHICTQDIRR
jgi:deoxyribonuclease V